MALFSRTARGRSAEKHAERFLRRKGFKILARNYSTRSGELDLVTLDGPVLVFVEVRSKRGAEFGTALESITESKQRQVARAARHYLSAEKLPANLEGYRFDVVTLDFPADGGEPRIAHVEAAFGAPEGFWT